jgi:hypothetical protein
MTDTTGIQQQIAKPLQKLHTYLNPAYSRSVIRSSQSKHPQLRS